MSRYRVTTPESACAREKPKCSKTNCWRISVATTWTPDRRTRQAEMIRNGKPWQQAAGPRMPDGKTTASMNAYKGGHWPMLRELSRLVDAEIRAAQDLEARQAVRVAGLRLRVAAMPSRPAATSARTEGSGFEKVGTSPSRTAIA